MDDPRDKPILTRNPVMTLTIVALVCGILGLILVLSVVGAIIGIPLIIVAAIAGGAAWSKQRKLNASRG